MKNFRIEPKYLLITLAFGITSVIFGEIKFIIPGLEGSASDLREVFILISVFYLPHWIYVAIICFITSLSTPADGSMLSTIIMHLPGGICSWYFFQYLQRKSFKHIIKGIKWAIWVIIYYGVIVIPLLVLTNYLFGIFTDNLWFEKYFIIIIAARFEIAMTMVSTSLFLIIISFNLELKEKLATLDLVHRGIEIGIWTMDLETDKKVYNEEYATMLGYTEQEINNKKDVWEKSLHPEDKDRVLRYLSNYLSGKEKNYAVEYRLKTKSGNWLWIHDEGKIIEYNEKDRSKIFTGIHLNITERIKLEEQFRQIQKMEAIGRLAGGVAHDFNNILVPIIGYTELEMRKLSPDDKLYVNLKRVLDAANRAAGLTQQILAFSRKQVLEMRVIDLNAVISDFKKMVQRLIGEDIELQTFLDSTLCLVKADKGQIEQVLLNLVVNARNAMPQGGSLTIETDHAYLDEDYVKKYVGVQTPGHYIMLAVSDNGHGMDAETQQQIFEPFFTTKGKGEGTGLGLATVFGIVKQHGGSIWVYSEPGKGATFKIYLPQAEAKIQTHDTVSKKPASLYGTETILVAEDEEMVRKLVCETLITHGYKVFEALGTNDALEHASKYKETIHLLLTDVIMPEMNGRDLYQKVASIHPAIKVLYISGYTDNVVVHHGILDEGTNFLQKPFTVQSLTRKVRQVLS